MSGSEGVSEQGGGVVTGGHCGSLPEGRQAELGGGDEGRGLRAATIPIGALNVGYSAGTASPLLEEVMAGGSGWTGGGRALAEAVCENSNDSFSMAPVTPQRAPEHSPGTPLTPLANLKMLIAAASSALDREKERGSTGREDAGVTIAEETSGRKMKSLAILCKRFLTIVESDVGEGNEFSLDMMSQSLGTNRRRIYDIINVLESLEMIVKQSKNWYTWSGRSNLIHTLAKLRAMAMDDAEFKSLFVTPDKENASSSGKAAEVEAGKERPRRPLAASSAANQSSVLPATSSFAGGVTDTSHDEGDPEGGKGGGGRWDKSLGVLCQKFIMVFLVSPAHEVTLEFAGSILMPDDASGSQYPPIQPPPSHKSKVRRLYDIANVLTTLGLIKKKTFMAPNHRKMPGYSWCGPSIAEIEAIPVSRKTEFGLGTLYPAKKGVALTRKPSFGNRPFLHQYEIQRADIQGFSPTITRDKSSRRSLSFGGHTPQPPIAPAPATCVLARPLPQKQLDVMKEVKEFEAEMQKHSHRYPHVASIFHDFINRYRSSLEQSTSGGRMLLPKPVPPGSPSSVPASLPGASWSPLELVVARTLLSSPNALQLVAQSVASSAAGRSPGSSSVPPASPVVASTDESILLPTQRAVQSTPSTLVPVGVATVGDALASGLSPFPPPPTPPRVKSLQELLPAVSSANDGSGIEPLPSDGTTELAEMTGVFKSTALQPFPIHLTCSESPLTTTGTLPLPPVTGLPSTPPLVVATEMALPITTQPSSGVTALVTDHHEKLSSSQGGNTQFGTITPVSTSPLTQTWTSLMSDVHSMPAQTLTSVATSVLHPTTNKNPVNSQALMWPTSPHVVTWTATQPVATPLPLPASLSTTSSQPKGYPGAAQPVTRPGVQGSPTRATGTLHSPIKPSQEFVDVEHFLVPAATGQDKASKEKERKATSSPCTGTPRLPTSEEILEVSLSESHQSTQLSPPSGVLYLPQAFRVSHITPSQPSVSFTGIVNQPSMPLAAEHALRKSTRAAAPLAFVPPLNFLPPSSHPTSTIHPTSYGVINPNLFLAGPSQPISPGLLFSNGHGAVYPLESGIVLPSASVLCPRAPGNGCGVLPAYLPDIVSSSSLPSEERKEISPPKRPRLE